MGLSGLVLGRSREHGISPPGEVAGAAIEGFAGCPANVTVAGAGVSQDFGGTCDQGGANPLPLPGCCYADASDGSGGGAEHGREHGIGARAAQQQGPGDVPGIIARDQHSGGGRCGEPAGPAGEGGRLECQGVGVAGAVRSGYGDAFGCGMLVGTWGRAVPPQVCYQVKGVMAVLPAVCGEEPDRQGDPGARRARCRTGPRCQP